MSEGEDQLLGALARLPAMAPDPGRENRVRQRCHDAMLRRGARRARTVAIRMTGIAGLCVYFAVMLAEAMRLTGSL